MVPTQWRATVDHMSDETPSNSFPAPAAESAADQAAAGVSDSAVPELDDDDPLLRPAHYPDGQLAPSPMPLVRPGPYPPAGIPAVAGGPLPAVPMPRVIPLPETQNHSAQNHDAQNHGAQNHDATDGQYAEYRQQSIGADWPSRPGTPWPGQQNPSWSGTGYGGATPTAATNAQTGPATEQIYGYYPPAGATQTMPPPARARRTTAIVAATVILALGAGFGGGVLGSRLAGGSAAAGTSAVDSSLTQQTSSQAAAAQSGTGTVESVAAAVLPSVVSVVATAQSSSGEGSGVVLTADGYILTNNHVISGASDLTVRFNDGTTASATVVGADTTGDLAVIKVDGVSGLTPAILGTSADLKVGEQVVAIGTPLGLSATVTSGIVSALNRPVRTASAETQQQAAASDTVLNAIQTDAAINPGNSGGPLVNMAGQIVGINSAIASLSSSTTSQSGSIGVGFAIPIDSAARIANEIMKTGSASHAVLGASVADNPLASGRVSTGATIKAVTSGGPAEAAGLQVGDVVTKIDGTLIESSDALVATVRSAAPGSQISVTLLRGTSTQTVTVTLGTSTAK